MKVFVLLLERLKNINNSFSQSSLRCVQEKRISFGSKVNKTISKSEVN